MTEETEEIKPVEDVPIEETEDHVPLHQPVTTDKPCAFGVKHEVEEGAENAPDR